MAGAPSPWRTALDVSATDAPEGPAYARDAALQYVLAHYPELEGMINPSAIRMPWGEENLTPQNWVGTNTVEYSKGHWSVTVTNAVVLEPVYTFEIVYTGVVSFSWSGTVDQTGAIEETEFEINR